MKTVRIIKRGVLVLALVLSMGLLGFGSGAAGNDNALAQTEEGGFTLPEGVSADLGDVLASLGIWTEVPVGGIAVAVLAPQISPVAEEQIVIEAGGGFMLPEGVSADLGDILSYLGIAVPTGEPVVSPVTEEQLVTSILTGDLILDAEAVETAPAAEPQISAGGVETAPTVPLDTSILTGDLVLDAEAVETAPTVPPETPILTGDLVLDSFVGY